MRHKSEAQAVAGSLVVVIRSGQAGRQFNG